VRREERRRLIVEARSSFTKGEEERFASMFRRGDAARPAPSPRLRDADDHRGWWCDALLRGRVEQFALLRFVFLLVEDAVVEERLGGAQRGDSGWLHS